MKTFIKKFLTLSACAVTSIFVLSGCGKEVQDTSVDDIRARGSFKVGILNYDTDLMYYDADIDAFRGTDAEVVDILSQSLGVPVEYTEMSSKDEMINAVKTGTIDIAIGNLNSSSQDIADLGKTLSYGNGNIYIVSPRGVYIGDLSVLKNQKVGVSQRLDKAAYENVYYSGATDVRIYSNSQSVYDALNDKTIAGYVCYKSEAQYLASDGSLQVQSCKKLPEENYVIVALPEKTRLIAGCNGLIESYLSGEAKTTWQIQEEEATASANLVEDSKLFDN